MVHKMLIWADSHGRNLAWFLNKPQRQWVLLNQVSEQGKYYLTKKLGKQISLMKKQLLYYVEQMKLNNDID